MILFIDNYDSFTYNLVDLIGFINPDLKVVRNDAINIEEIEQLNPSHIILSPGPGYPKNAGICEDVIKHFGSKIPILGICLGHQAICEVYGASIVHAKQLMHGKQSIIQYNLDPIFEGLKKDLPVARYHSLVADPNTMPDCLTILATDSNNEIMAVKHKQYLVYGMQFHPESFMTPDGVTILKNFLTLSI